MLENDKGLYKMGQGQESINFSSRNRNRKLEISTSPTKAESREPAYLQALVQNKIVRERVKTALFPRGVTTGGDMVLDLGGHNS